MSEAQQMHSQGTTTAGALLRQAREAAGMDIAVLASMLKVPTNKLQALEDDNFVELPDAVFARAVAASVCRTLHIESARILALLPHNEAPRLRSHSDGINTTFKEPGAKMALPSLRLSSGSRRAMWAAVGLLLAAAAVYFVPSELLQHLGGSAAGASASGATQADEGEAPEPVLAREPSPPPIVASAPAPQFAASMPAPITALRGSVSSATPTVSPALTVSTAPTVVASTPSVPAPSAALASAPVVAASTTAAATAGVLEFRAKAESWVQVRDASGRVTFERVLKAGDAVQAPGKPPLSVVVGRAATTEVLVRGAAFDLTAIARDNVARFEVK